MGNIKQPPLGLVDVYREQRGPASTRVQPFFSNMSTQPLQSVQRAAQAKDLCPEEREGFHEFYNQPLSPVPSRALHNLIASQMKRTWLCTCLLLYKVVPSLPPLFLTLTLRLRGCQDSCSNKIIQNPRSLLQQNFISHSQFKSHPGQQNLSPHSQKFG